MATRSVRQVKSKFATNRGRIVGVLRCNGAWQFIVQRFSTDGKDTPILCGLATVDQLKGNVKKKAQNWTAYLDGTGAIA